MRFRITSLVIIATLIAGLLFVGDRRSSVVPVQDPFQVDFESKPKPGKLAKQVQSLGPGPLAIRISSTGGVVAEPAQPLIQTRYAFVLDPEIPLSDWRNAVRRTVITSAPENVQQHRKRAESGDAESAYWMYLYFEYCRHQPKSAWQLDILLSRLVERLDQNLRAGWEGAAERASDGSAALEQGFRLCSLLEPNHDFFSEALEWLELAADLGHMGAQRLYHRYARQLIVGFATPPPLLLSRPELIGEFQLRADRYARALLQSGHPQGFLLLARMLFVGDVYQQDVLVAYAYALAVEQNFGEVMRQQARISLDWIGKALPPAKLPEAESLARELLRRHGH